MTGELVARYKRFLADIRKPTGEVFTAHCPNTGAMTGCSEPGSEVWYSVSTNQGRKYPCTLEVVVTPTGRIGVNTARANSLIAEAVTAGRLTGLEGCELERREVAIPDERGRFDLLLVRDGQPVYVEIKNLTLREPSGRGVFPDAVSERAVKHVKALARRARAGDAAVLVFCVQHTGIVEAATADAIHPAYGAAVRAAVADGVAVLAFGCRIERDLIEVGQALPVRL